MSTKTKNAKYEDPRDTVDPTSQLISGRRPLVSLAKAKSIIANIRRGK